MARTAVVVFIVAVCWQRRRAFAVMAWIARLIRFCGLLGLQISFSAECALKLEISFCPRRPGTSGGPPFQNANPEAAPVTGSELPGLTTVPLAGPPLQFARADVPEPSPEPPGKPLPTALGPWDQGAAPPRRKAPPPLPPYCGLCASGPQYASNVLSATNIYAIPRHVWSSGAKRAMMHGCSTTSIGRFGISFAAWGGPVRRRSRRKAARRTPACGERRNRASKSWHKQTRAYGIKMATCV